MIPKQGTLKHRPFRLAKAERLSRYSAALLTIVRLYGRAGSRGIRSAAPRSAAVVRPGKLKSDETALLALIWRLVKNYNSIYSEPLPAARGQIETREC